MKNLKVRGLFCALLAVAVLSVGCGQPVPAKPVATAETKEHDDHAGHDHGPSTKSATHDHSGWWCNEHGVPEEECGRCSAKVAANFQKNGDWCKEHDRPDSQCFVCHPEKEAVYAAKYEAKYGKQPPKAEVN